MSVAAVTMVYNEPDMLPIWVGHYGRHLGLGNLLVIDHGSDPPASRHLPAEVNRLRVPRGLKSEVQRWRFLSDVARGLLRYHRGVICTDCDELLVPDPDRHRDLAAFWRDGGPPEAPVLAPIGVELFEAEGRDAPLDLSRPLGAQRRFGRFRSLWCKAVVLRRPATWTPGGHYTDQPPHVAPGAVLFHLKAIDRRRSLDRLAVTRRFRLAPKDLRAGLSFHQQATDEEHLRRYYGEPSAQLARDGAAPWDFSADLDRLRAELTPMLGAWRFPDWTGPAVRVPDRFARQF